jgi:hypothetical protein
LGISKEKLKSYPEFNFDSGDQTNLEGSLAILRTVNWLQRSKFQKIKLIVPAKNQKGADILCEKNGQKICLEVKAITKASGGHKNLFLHLQLYEKIKENIGNARIQLAKSAELLKCRITIFVCVFNWIEQSVILLQKDYPDIVDLLEKHGVGESLTGIDGVLFITKMGEAFLFLNERAKCLDT